MRFQYGVSSEELKKLRPTNKENILSLVLHMTWSLCINMLLIGMVFLIETMNM